MAHCKSKLSLNSPQKEFLRNYQTFELGEGVLISRKLKKVGILEEPRKGGGDAMSVLHGAFAAILEDVKIRYRSSKEEASSRPRFFAGLVAAAGRRDEDAKKSIEHLTKQLRSSNAAAVERLRASEEQTLKLAQRLNDVRMAKKALTPKVLPAAATFIEGHRKGQTAN